MTIAAATVHFPYMTAWPERASPQHKALTDQGFARIRAAFSEAGVDTLIVVTSEHIVNLAPRMAPAFVVGAGAVHPCFPEPQFNLEVVNRPGHPELARHLLDSLYQQGFDPAHSIDLQLDHGTTLPLQQLGVPATIRIVPLVINTLFPPLPTLARCLALGKAIGQALEHYPERHRVGVLATGGVSHAVGMPGFDKNDPKFDQAFIDALLEGRLDDACAYSDAQLDRIGNGTHEIRNWLVAAGAQAGKPELVTAIPFVPGWDAGVYQLLWSN